MTVRTPHHEDHTIAGIPIPVSIPVHLHMYSLHNSQQYWDDPKAFKPERWLTNNNHHNANNSDPSVDEDGSILISKHFPRKSRPTCPFLSSLSSSSSSAIATAGSSQVADDYVDYSGLGFEEDSMNYFPFSVGARECLGKQFVVRFFSYFIYELVPKFRLDPVEEPMEQELGNSTNAIIIPMNAKQLVVKVMRVKVSIVEDEEDEEQADRGAEENTQESNSTVQKKAGRKVKIEAEEANDDGWAEE
jgi:cytochrome P450